MKFILPTQEFNYLISKIQNIIPLKPTSPILNNFLIEASNDELVLTATDLTVSIRCQTEIKVLEEGSTTLPAKKLAQLVRELSAPNLEISSDSNEITTLVAGSSRFKLNGIGTIDYPEMPNLSEAATIEVKQDKLKELLFRTSFAVSKEDNRYALTGLLMSISDGLLTFTGTDGKRLARAQAPLEIALDLNTQSVIPLKAIDEIVKNLVDEEGTAKISIMPDKIAVFANQTLVVTKLLSGDYPDISRVIPEETPIKITLHREEMLSLLRQVSLFAVDHHHSACFQFTQGELKLSANTHEFGEGHVAMPVNYQGSDLEIAFNPGFFIDILRHCKEEVVTIGLVDPFNPGLITDGEPSEEQSKDSALFVIMPMRMMKD